MSLRTVQRPGGDEVEGHIIPESTRKRQGGEVEDIEAHSRHAANWTAHQGEQRLDGHKIDPATPGPAPVLPFSGSRRATTPPHRDTAHRAMDASVLATRRTYPCFSQRCAKYAISQNIETGIGMRLQVNMRTREISRQGRQEKSESVQGLCQ